MTRDEALSVVREVLSDQLGIEPDEVVPEANLREDLGMDSIDAIDLIVGVEAEFGEQLPQEELMNVETVKDMLDVVERRTSAGTTP